MIDVREAIKSGEIIPKRTLGQCFLTERSFAERIVRAAELAPGDHVIEVGPGVCAITGLLCEQARTVTAVEIDNRLTKVIGSSMSRYDNFRLVNADILRVPADLLLPGNEPPHSADLTDGGDKERFKSYGGFPGSRAGKEGDTASRIVLVSNMPYYISTPIMTRLFEEFSFVDMAVLMMQREVADKLAARPSTGNFCLLTVLAQSFCQPEKLFSVPPHCFTPQPGVESVVMALTARRPPAFNNAAEKRIFFQVARAAFARRRKTIENSLMFAGLAQNRAQAETALARADIPPGARGESLGFSEFASLARVLASMPVSIPG